MLAVRCRLRGRDDVGVMLSGGIDSSSIAATARRQGPVRSYSAVSDHDDTTETAFIRATTAKLSMDASYVDPSQVHESCGDFTSVQRSCESLFDNGAMVRTVFDAASQDGCRSVVTGAFADEVVAIPASLAMRSTWPTASPAKVVRLAGIARQPGHSGWTARTCPVGDLGDAQTQRSFGAAAVESSIAAARRLVTAAPSAIGSFVRTMLRGLG